MCALFGGTVHTNLISICGIAALAFLIRAETQVNINMKSKQPSYTEPDFENFNTLA